MKTSALLPLDKVVFAQNSNETMNDITTKVGLTPLAKILRLYLRSGLRGATRLTFLLARNFRSLQHLPLEIPGWSPVYVDLRLGDAHILLMNSPYEGFWREPNEIAIMRRFVRTDDVVFDIGANIGLHTILLSRLVGSRGKIFVFEPNAELLPALRHTVGQLGNATLKAIALSNQDRRSALFVPPDHSTASLADWTPLSPVFSEDGPSHIVKCEERRTDSLVEEDKLPLPDFVKCDVEGAELLVFEGARQTLNRVDAPIILFEANQCASRAFNMEVSAAKDFLAALESPRYSFFEIQTEGKLERLREVRSSFLNILAIPAARVSHWPELAEL
jgi:FkbM family methyltransferase